MDHDQRFKSLLREFFQEFMLLFFPDWFPRFVFSGVDWLEQEIFPDPPEGDRRAVDLLARVPVRVAPEADSAAAEFWMVLIHIEIESADSVAPLRQRMCRYYHFLRSKHELPVLPIGLYLRVGLDGVGWDTYAEEFWGHRLMHFEYPYIGLPALDGEAFARGDNLLGVALSALMRLPDERRVQIGVESSRRLIECQESNFRRFLLGECVTAYIARNEDEHRAFAGAMQTQVSSGESAMNRFVFELMEQEAYKQWRQEGLQAGRQEGLQAGRQEGLQAGRQEGLQAGRQEGLQAGRQEGLQAGRQEGLQAGRQEGLQAGRQEGRQEANLNNLLALIESRFGAVSHPVRQLLTGMSPDALEQLFRAALQAPSMHDLGLGD